MGAIGGTIWHSIKGARNSPRGDRLIGSIAAVKARAPVVGGNVRLFPRNLPARNALPKVLRQSSIFQTVWRLGWHVLLLRLFGQGLQTKGGRLERCPLWLHDRRLVGLFHAALHTSSKRAHMVCTPSCPGIVV